MRTFSAARLKQALWQGAGLAAAETSAAVCVDEAVCDLLARRAEVRHGGDRFLADRFPDDGMPLLPLALGGRLVACVEQHPPAESAPAVLAAPQVPGRGADRGPVALAALAPLSDHATLIGA